MRSVVSITSIAVLLAVPAWAEPQPISSKLLDGSEIRAELKKAYRGGPDAMVRLAKALGQSGGRPAMEGLTELHRHRTQSSHSCVRIAALNALTRVRLRSEDVDKCIKRSMRGSWREKSAAILAIGKLGSGRDMQKLLEFTRDEEPEVQRAAYRSLRRLTGASIPNVHARWSQWWRAMQKRAWRSLPNALDKLEEAPDDPGAKEHLDAAVQHGWADLDEVEAAITEWVGASDPLLQAAACHLSNRLRLADFGPRIAKIRVNGFDPPQLEAEVRSALANLGMAKELKARLERDTKPLAKD